MLADHRHPEVGAVLAAVAPRNGEAQMAGVVGEILGMAQQRFPFMTRQAAILEIGPRPFAAMIEEADVVVLRFQRLDLERNEAVELGGIGDEIRRQGKIQGALPRSCLALLPPIKVRAQDQVKQGGANMDLKFSAVTRKGAITI